MSALVEVIAAQALKSALTSVQSDIFAVVTAPSSAILPKFILLNAILCPT